MKSFRIVVLSILLLGFTACKNDKRNATQDVTGVSTYYLIRHAEKDRTNDQDPDPELSQTGLGRAMHWAEILRSADINAIYSTDYQRTAMTAAPMAIKHNLEVQYYDPQNIDIEQFKLDNLNQNVLVVGHSNTIPDFANSLLDDEVYGQIDDSENGSLFIVTIINGMATSKRLEINFSYPSRN